MFKMNYSTLLFSSCLMFVAAGVLNRETIDVRSVIQKYAKYAIYDTKFPSPTTNDMLHYQIDDFQVTSFQVNSAMISNFNTYGLTLTLKDLIMGFDGEYYLTYNNVNGSLVEDWGRLNATVVDIEKVTVEVAYEEGYNSTVSQCTIVPDKLTTDEDEWQPGKTQTLTNLFLADSNIDGSKCEQMVCETVKTIVQSFLPEFYETDLQRRIL